MKPRKSPGEKTAGQFDRTHEAATDISFAFTVTAEIAFFAGTGESWRSYRDSR